MNKSSKTGKPNVVVPAAAALRTWSAQKWKTGVQVDQFEKLETLSVETLNHTYEITVIDPGTAEVLVQGGRFPERTVAHLSGASLGSAFLKVHGIYVGFSMELRVGGKPIITSPVRSIRVLEPKSSGTWGEDSNPIYREVA
jgi:hypothetical protein